MVPFKINQKSEGWHFDTSDSLEPGCIPDTVNNFSHLSQIYKQQDESYAGRFTVPILYDKQTKLIVNNESSQIIRILNTAFNEFANPEDFYPENLRSEINDINSFVYEGINNGVYRAGFATSQSAYDSAVTLLFESLERVESILISRKWLCGTVFTEADIRLFTTIVRFDAVYHTHFKCNVRMIHEFPGIYSWLKRVLDVPGVRETVDMNHIKKHYYMSHLHINPTGIVPKGLGWEL